VYNDIFFFVLSCINSHSWQLRMISYRHRIIQGLLIDYFHHSLSFFCASCINGWVNWQISCIIAQIATLGGLWPVKDYVNIVEYRTPLRRGVLDTTLCDEVCQSLATGRRFSPGTPVSSTNKTDCHHITEILWKVALNIPCIKRPIITYKSKMSLIETYCIYSHAFCIENFHLWIILSVIFWLFILCCIFRLMSFVQVVNVWSLFILNI